MDIYLEDTFVSSKHALFEATAEGFQVEDLRSTNGTQVNGADISGPRPLGIGDRIEVGDTVFQVEVR
jgi:pSer/pThr/pTyr-binding forkhead associated (FHA) protein